MEDEVVNNTEHVPQLRTSGRRRMRPMSDQTAVIKTLQEQNQQLQVQIQNLMNTVLQSASNQPILGLPPKPHVVEPPKGFLYWLSLKVPEDGLKQQTTFAKVVPQRPDNLDEPDPRYCVFCSSTTYELTMKKKGANLAEVYGLDIPGNPDEQQMRQLQQVFRQHFAEIAGYENSKKKQLKRMYADHYSLDAVKGGRVPDIITFRTTGRKDQKDKEICRSAAQANEHRLKEWEAQKARILAGQGR